MGLHLADMWRSWRSWGEAHPVAESALLVTVVKLALLVADPTVNLPVDSERCLDVATLGWVNAACPVGYALVVRLLAVATHSLVPLVLVQTVAGGAAAVAVGQAARVLLAVRPIVSLAAAVVLAAAPLQLSAERSVAPDGLAVAVLTGWLVLGIAWLARRRLAVLLVFSAAAVSIGVLEGQLVAPAAVGVIAALLLAGFEALAQRRGLPRRHLVRLAVHAAAALIVLIAGVAAWWTVPEVAAGRRPAGRLEDGFLTVVARAPLLLPEDAPNPKVAEVIAAPSPYPLADRSNLFEQRWAPGGLAERLRALDPDPAVTERWAAATAAAAARRDPLGIVGLGAAAWADALVTRAIDDGLRAERSRRAGPTTRTIELLRDRFSLAVTPEWARRSTVTRRWHWEALPWYRLLALAPLVGFAAVAVARRGRRLTVLWLALVALSLLVSALGFGVVSPRLLSPLEPVVVLLFAVLVDAFGGRRGAEPLLIPVIDRKPALAAPGA